MEAVGVYIDSPEYKLSTVEILRGLVTEKMTTAVREILAVVETTVSGYENEVSLLKRELDRHKRQLDAILQPQVNLYRIGLDDAGSPGSLCCVSTDENKDDSRHEHKDTENKDHGISEICTGKSGVDSVPLKVSHQEMVSLEHEESDCTLVDLPSDFSVSCPANREESHSDDKINDAQNKDTKNKRKRRMPKRYRSNSDDSDNYDIDENRDNEWKPDKNKKLKSFVKKKHLIKLRIGLLMNGSDTELSNNAFRLEGPVQTIMCNQNLSESDFLNQLRSTFPELREDKPFGAFFAESSKRLLPHLENLMTPNEVYKAFRSTGKRQLSFYIQLKEHKDICDSLTNTPPTSNDDKPSTSSHSSLAEEQPSETGGTSKSPDKLGNMSSADSAAESKDEEDDDDDRSDDWEPEQDNEDGEHSDASKSDKRIRGCSKKKRREPQLSSNKCTNNSDSCKVCGILCRSKTILTKHALSHVNNPEGICGVCGQQEESSEELRCHLETHQKVHQCDTCGRLFITIISFQNHIAAHKMEKLFQCQFCQKAFTHKTLLTKHELDHKDDKPHKCDTCPQSFLFKTQLDIHKRKHTGEKPYCCDICGKFLSDFRSLSRHKLTHTGQKNYSCKHCGKLFYTSARQKQHEKIHTTRERNFLCDICSKTFYTPSELRSHQQRHEDKHIIKCPVCNKLLKGNLEMHMMMHTGQKRYSCSECGWKFRSQTHLKNHIRTHLGIKPFTCTVCGKSCGRKEHLVVHMRTHTGHKPYKCTVCDKAFTQSHCLKTHMKCHQTEEQSAVDVLA